MGSSARELAESRTLYVCTCIRCEGTFNMYRTMYVGGNNHGRFRPGPVLHVCPECAAKQARVQYPDMAVTVKH